MKKDNLVFALSGVVIGMIVGVLIANQSPQRIQATEALVQQTVTQAPQQEQLPEGHPPIDQTLQNQIAEQQEILKKDPENQTAIVAVANLNYDLKNHKEATKWYEKALEKDPNNINLITDLGTSYLQLQDFDKSLAQYKKALTINPKHYQTLMNLGIARMAVGDNDGAAEAWEKLIAFYPDDPNTGMIKDALQKMKAKAKG